MLYLREKPQGGVLFSKMSYFGTSSRGVYNRAAFDFIHPPCVWLSSRDVLRCFTNPLIFFPFKAIKQYILGLNSVKLCCSNCVLPFGTTKSVKSSINFFLDFLTHLQTLWFYFPPHGGEGNTQLYTSLAENIKVCSQRNPQVNPWLKSIFKINQVLLKNIEVCW